MEIIEFGIIKKNPEIQEICKEYCFNNLHHPMDLKNNISHSTKKNDRENEYKEIFTEIYSEIFNKLTDIQFNKNTNKLNPNLDPGMMIKIFERSHKTGRMTHGFCIAKLEWTCENLGVIYIGFFQTFINQRR